MFVWIWGAFQYRYELNNTEQNWEWEINREHTQNTSMKCGENAGNAFVLCTLFVHSIVILFFYWTRFEID